MLKQIIALMILTLTHALVHLNVVKDMFVLLVDLQLDIVQTIEAGFV